jgi:hypothetical protein
MIKIKENVSSHNDKNKENLSSHNDKKNMANFPDIFFICAVKSFMSHVSLLYVENVQIFCGHLNDFLHKFRVLFTYCHFTLTTK